MTIDVQQLRADFPILAQQIHTDKPLIFLDNAASSQKPTAVLDALAGYYQRDHANVHRGVHTLSERATEAYEGARDKVQVLLNAAHREEIIYTRNTTEALNLVAMSWGRANLTDQDAIILSTMEHHSNMVPWQILQEMIGFTIYYIPLTDELTFDMDAYYQFLQHGNIKLVSVTHVSNVLGYQPPVKDMIAAAHGAGALFCLDGAQSVPHQVVDVQALDVDFFAFSGHKIYAPTGIGILYGKKAILDAMPPYMGGGDMIRKVTLEGSTWNDLPYKFEAGTPAIAEAIGLGAAVDYLNQYDMAELAAYEHQLVAYAHEQLQTVPTLRLLAPPDIHASSVAAFTLEHVHPHDVAQLLDYSGIAVRAGHHCTMPLHKHLKIPASSRASVSFYNTHDEIDALVTTLKAIVKRFDI